MPPSAEEEAERLKKEREAAAAKQSDQHQAVIARTLPSGMVKEQMLAQAERPDANNKTQELKDYERRQEADAELKARYAKAAENNPPHPTIQHSELIAADNAKALAETIKADERAKEEQRKDSDKSQQRTAGAPSAFAQRHAEYDNQHTQTQEQQRQQEVDAAERRFANRRSVAPERYQPLRDYTEREQSDWRQRQAARAEQRPAREETEKQQSLANSSDSKQKDKDGAER